MVLLNKNSSHYWIYASLLVLLLIIVFIPIDLPYIIKTSGKVLPETEWIITKGTDGRILSSLINNKTGVTQNYKANVFERGDAVNLFLDPKLETNFKINANDSVASIISSELEENLVEIRGKILTEQANLASIESGEKSSIIKAAQKRITYAETKVNEQQKIVERNKNLWKSELISEEDYEISLSTLMLYKTNVEIAKDELATVKSGEKQELIKFAKAKIEALKDHQKILLKRNSEYNLISPISGIVERSYSQDTLLIVSDNINYTVFIPILYKEINKIKIGQKVEFTFDPIQEIIVGEVSGLGNRIHQIGGNQVVMITASFKNSADVLVSGMMVKTNIYCDDISLFTYITNWFLRLLA